MEAACWKAICSVCCRKPFCFFSLCRSGPAHLLLLHLKVGAAVLHEHVVLAEAGGVEQQVDALARREPALRVALVDGRSAAAEHRLLARLFNALLHILRPLEVRLRENGGQDKGPGTVSGGQASAARQGGGRVGVV